MPSPAQGCTYVKSVADAVLAGKARSHAVALVIKELALEQGTAFRKLGSARDGVGFELLLHLFECLPIENRLVLSLEPFSAVMGLADIDAVFQEVGEGTVSEGNATIVLG